MRVDFFAFVFDGVCGVGLSGGVASTAVRYFYFAHILCINHCTFFWTAPDFMETSFGQSHHGVR